MNVMRAIAVVSLMYLMSVSIAFAGSYEEKKDAFTGRTSVIYEISGGGLTDGVNVKLSEYDEAEGTLLLNFVARGQGRMDPAIGLKTADGTIHELTGEGTISDGMFVRIPADWVKDRITLRAKVFSPNLVGVWKERDRVVELDTSDLDLSKIAKQQQ